MPKFNILKKEQSVYYTTYKIKINEREIVIKFTRHAIDRLECWKLTGQEVLRALLFPDEVVIGHRQRFIAHKCKGKRVIRIIYEYRENIPVVITVYVPQKERYFQGGGKYADKIFSRGRHSSYPIKRG